MFNTINEYPLELIGEPQNIVVPKGSEILTVQVLYDKLYIWILTPRNSISKETKIIQIYQTHGFMQQDICEFKYISTVKINGNSSVYHIFEIKEKIPYQYIEKIK